jgi:uncharacterized membrane protein YeaQ/YmgE (transglycosylase-associated protein family)
MAILSTLIIGLLVGVIAQWVLPGKDPGGPIITLLVGIAGAFVADFLGHTAGWFASGDPLSMVGSVIGAIVLLTIYRLTMRRRRRS